MDLHEILQAKAYCAILTETARIDYLKKNFSAKITEKASTEELPADILAEIDAAEGETLGDRVISYVVGYDPSPNKQYSQWIIHRYLKGLSLEDLGRAFNALTLFDKAKARIEIKDINQYPDLSSLEAALEPFRTGKVDVSKAAERRRLKSDENTEVLYDGDDLLVVIAKTPEAASFWGKNTRWCTTSENGGRFQQYNREGPLYVIIDRSDNQKYQFHFPSGQFMDETDRRILLSEFIDRHPSIMDILGRDKFLAIWQKVGLRHFREDEIARIERGKLLGSVATVEDLLSLPDEIQNAPETALVVLFDKCTITKELVRHFLSKKQLTVEQIDDYLTSHYNLLAALPPRLQSEERKSAVFKAISGWTDKNYWSSIDDYIPKPWSEEIEKGYWDSKTTYWGMWTSYSEIPEKNRTNEMLVNLVLAKLPHNDEKRQKMLAREIPHLKLEDIQEILAANLRLIDYLPESAFKPAVVQAIGSAILKRYIPAEDRYGDDLLAIGNIRHPANVKIKEIIKKVKAPLGWWPASLFPIFVKHTDLKFAEIPASKRTPEVVTAYLGKRGSESIMEIPPELLTREQVVKAASVNHSLLRKLSKTLVDESVVLDVIKNTTYYGNDFDEQIPPRLMTVTVQERLVEKGILSISKMAPVLFSPENLGRRLGGLSGDKLKTEWDSIPSSQMTAANVIEIVAQNLSAMKYVPDSLLSEPLLRAFLSHTYSSDSQKQFDRFPKTMWSKEVAATAIDKGYIEPKVDEVPEDHFSSEAAISILAKNASEVGRVPEDYLDEQTLVQSVNKNFDLIKQISDDRLTEPVITSAMRYAPHTQGEYRAVLSALPRERFSKETYEAAVGYILTLKDVPAKMRDQRMKLYAINRDPFNLRFVPNATEWIKNSGILDGKSNYDTWHTKFEEAGYFVVGTGRNQHVIDVEELPKEKMPSGGSIVIKKVGTKNLRCYVFDKKGKIAGRFWSKNGKFEVPYSVDLKPHRQTIIDAFAEHHELYEFSVGDLAALEIYEVNSHITPVEQIQRKKSSERSSLSWSIGDDTSSNRYFQAWLDNKPVMRLKYGSSKRAFGKSTNYVTVDRMYDINLAAKYSQEIYGFMQSQGMLRYVDGYGSEWFRMGFLKIRSGPLHFLHKVQLARHGTMSVWTGDDNRVGLFGPNGMIAHAKVLKGGRISSVSPHHSYDGDMTTLQQVFALAEKKLSK